MPDTSGILQGQYWGPILVYIFINDLDDEAKCRFAGYTKWDKMDDRPGGCAAIQRDIDKQWKWAARNLIKFSKGKYKSPSSPWEE